MFGVLIGALAVGWGILIAVLDQPAGSSGRHLSRLCAALLIGSAAVAIAGGVVATVR